MSRLEAVAVGLYYPTPEPVVAALARYLRLPPGPGMGAPLPTSSYPPLQRLPVSHTPTIRLLDPCAGKGRALALLAETLRQQASIALHERRGASPVAASSSPASSASCSTALEPLELYGVEPNTERALEAQGRIPHLLATSYFTATLSEGGFQLAFVNPPYDLEAETDAVSAVTGTPGAPGASGAMGAGGAARKRERLELRFLRRTTAKLAADGVLVWIVPQRLLREGAKHLAEHYRDLACWRFPDASWRPPDAPADRPATPMYAAFGQVALVGQRRRVPVPADAATLDRIERWATLGAALDPLPLDPSDPTPAAPLSAFTSAPDAPQYTLPWAVTPLRYFLAATFDPDVVAAQVSRPSQGVWGERGYVERHWPDLDASDLGIGQPLAPLRRGHLALLAAAGIANGQELTGTDGRRLVVKGACRKVTVREQSEERDPTSGERIQVVTETERFEVTLWAIDLETGEVVHIV